ncbi:MAG: DHHA1 domain-containing protein [Crenarchaeota archaeon]|nr:DHHA1 domain-containing protein [Thermoproteota archaeon]MCR8455066.1 DHHA1 domain-containing protein [Thermoproteota archaeon]MCR8501028.1 DHHA1 domain-containing protein [Thermoproteota archaeon]
MNKKSPIIACHKEDIDGIVSAALILRIFPDAVIIFAKPNDITRMKAKFDIVCDLPKPKFCDVCIDHHMSNYQQLLESNKLSEKDLVDPNASSAARLVAKYFNLNDEISRELVEMADKADSGYFDEDLTTLDLLIKHNSNDPAKLHWIAKKLAQNGRKIFDDPEFRMEAFKLRHLILKKDEIIKLVNSILEKGIKACIFDCRSLDPALGRIAPTVFCRIGGKAAVSIYFDDVGNIKVSIRVDDTEFDAGKFASLYGGGGHAKAAGVVFADENSLAKFLSDFISTFKEYSIAFLRIL